MGLIHWIRAGAETSAKRAFLRSVGVYRVRGGYWESYYSKTRMQERDIRRWTLAELKNYYMHYLF